MLLKMHVTTNRQRGLYALAILALIATGLAAGIAMPAAQQPTAPGSAAKANRSNNVQLGALPLYFEPNVGQTDPGVRFVAHAYGGDLFFMRSGVALSLQGAGPTADLDASRSAAGKLEKPAKSTASP